MNSKIILIAIMLFALFSFQSMMADVPLKSKDDSVAYAIGTKVGSNISMTLKQDSMALSTDIIVAGFKAALKEEKLQLTEEQVNAFMTQLQQDMMQKQQQKMQELGEKNKKESEAYLAANAKKEGVKILPDGLQYKVIKEGTGKKPSSIDTVKVHYTGTLPDGRVFDSSVQRGQPAKFPVTGVIKGWTEALQLMNEGSKWIVYLPADLAYGERGAGQDIGPNQALIFEVEPLQVIPPGSTETGTQKPAKK